MLEKVLVGLVSGLLSAALAYGNAASRFEGRVDGIEKALLRIEARLK